LTLMNDQLFGTDGVRGLANDYPLNSDGCYAIGRAVGVHFAELGQSMVIACDTRESSPRIVQDITRGINSTGVDSVSVGNLTTPGLAYITKNNDQFQAGIMVTASHNLFQYNGVKVFDKNGNKLSSDVEQLLNKLIKDGVDRNGEGLRSESPSLIDAYEDFLVESVADHSLEFKLAVDSANGSSSGLAEKVMNRLGNKVVALHDKPDGKNINEKCGATDTKSLSDIVLNDKLDLGIAFDGDADRVIFIDDTGREVKGDYLLYVLALCNGFTGVVATVMSNVGFEMALKDKGIDLKRTAVGDHNIIEELAETGYKLGGEESGHIVLPDLLNTGDGLLAAVQILKDLKESGKKLSEWCNEVKLVPQALVNIEHANKEALNNSEVVDFIADQSRLLGNNGRLLIRPSGTEPLVRVMVEAEGAQSKAEEIANKLKDLIS
jgi:phosphoglucosamine mutase